MKQILQSLKTGATEIAEVPCPSAKRGQLLIRTTQTLVSVGTERMLVEFGKAGWIDKARQQPDKVRMVLDKIKTDGLKPTIETVINKLDQPLPLGYCNVGVVMEAGNAVTSFSIGDRVASNGKHAEVVSVPINLCARIPDAVTDEEAAFTVIASIALQGIRLVQPTLGECVVVTGLGLIGLVALQLLRAHGCRVLGIDYDADKLTLAKQFGAEVVNLSAGEDPVAAAQHFSRGRGVDAVIITASTKSNEPVHQAALMCRKRGRIVLVGVTGLELSRADFFEKELTFQVSCSYGPGRYDPNYEEKGQDYPVGFVRWTEQRNFEAVLDMLADGRLDVKPLISHRFAINEAEKAYELIANSVPSMGILLQYPAVEEKSESMLRQQTVKFASQSPIPSQRAKASIAFVGAGNYATAVLIPAFKETGARMKIVASSGGVSGVHAGRKYGFEVTTTDTDSVFADPEVNTVVITTRHDSHAQFVLRALEAGKNIFVEKPLCLTLDELEEIRAAVDRRASLAMTVGEGVMTAEGDAMTTGKYAALSGSRHCEELSDAAIQLPIVMVGFNRRFSPHIQKIKLLLASVNGPKAFVMTVNAGTIPSDHWTQDKDVGGGRIVGEGCHFIDLLRHLADVPIVAHSRMTMHSANGDTVSLQLGFADGSIGTVHYFSNGSKAFPKERLEVFAAGRVLQLDNFRELKGYAWPGFKSMNLWSQDKGQKACAAAFVKAISEGGAAPIPFSEIMEVTRVSILLAS